MRLSLTTSIAVLFCTISCIAAGRASSALCAEEGEKAKACGVKGKKPAPDACCAGYVCGSKHSCVLPPVTGACPAWLKVRCVTWAVTGGQGQSIHAMVSIMDENGDPVVGAAVTMETTDPKDETTVFESVTGRPWVNYISDLMKTCGGVAAAVTSDKCYQKADKGWYSAAVTSVSLEGCDDAQIDLGVVTVYEF
eukprot:CAMPEP_0119015248 /NCGR_PEP_ID=MMETSP1176-20130426/10677_1 /TAXON_ID=265551 /ORGANISM="Synedropsis recta cf, Strain CCMP1620" /LENGTH=193 /DNA_ID=CAMNT_0006968525 /DNA_START=25 /DNA_END=606 /DNA_ORIENTATION=+